MIWRSGCVLRWHILPSRKAHMGIESLPCDELAGYVVQVDGTGTALICGAPYGPLPGEVLHHGPMVLRYGIPLLLKKDTLLVEWVFDDFRREHRGDARSEEHTSELQSRE